MSSPTANEELVTEITHGACFDDLAQHSAKSGLSDRFDVKVSEEKRTRIDLWNFEDFQATMLKVSQCGKLFEPRC